MKKMQSLYKSIWQLILTKKQFSIVTHVEPDGDTLGSATALKEMILAHNPQAEVKIIGQRPPRYLEFISDIENVSDDYFYRSQVIVVDTSTITRIADLRVTTLEAIKIDHHPCENTWLAEIGGDYWPSTGQVLYEMALELKLNLTARARDAIFVAIWTDTEGLTQRNISSVTHEAIKNCSANKNELLQKMGLNQSEKTHIDKLAKQLQTTGDVTHLITTEVVSNDYLRQMTGIFSNQSNSEVYFGVTKTANGWFRGELRSKGKFDVSVLAHHFGGGGHFSSSGFKKQSLTEIQECLQYTLKHVK